MQSQQIWRSSILLISMVCASIASSATANDFRIETEIFVEDDALRRSHCRSFRSSNFTIAAIATLSDLFLPLLLPVGHEAF